MRKVLALILLVSIASFSFAKEPANLSKAKANVIQYVKSGQYTKRVTAVYHRAVENLKKRMTLHKTQHEQKKLAVVLDIDETVLSNYDHMKHVSFGGSKETIQSYIAQGDDPVLQPALKYIRFAQRNNVEVFFVTGRSEMFREPTIKNLHKAGIAKWNKLFMRPENYHARSIIPFKSEMRAKIENLGYKVVASIGDQWSDIRGGHVEKGYKLPNPFYTIP